MKTMKRMGWFICVWSLLVFCVGVVPVQAEDSEVQTQIEYLEDGSYYVTTITTEQGLERSVKSGSKSTQYFDASNKLQWTFTVTGTFSYNGSSSSCTKATYSLNIANDAWKKESASAYASGNRAVGKVSMQEYLLFLPKGDAVNRTITLTCDAKGNLS